MWCLLSIQPLQASVVFVWVVSNCRTINVRHTSSFFLRLASSLAGSGIGMSSGAFKDARSSQLKDVWQETQCYFAQPFQALMHFFLFSHTIMLLSRKGTGSLQEMKDPCTAPPYNTFNSICSSSIFWGKNFETSPSACYQENNNNHVTSSNKLQFMGKLWKICIYGINYLLGEILTEVIHLQRRD